MRPLATHNDDDALREREEAERFAALLTQAAYLVARRHGTLGSFADLELDLWRELRGVVNANLVGVCQTLSGVSRA